MASSPRLRVNQVYSKIHVANKFAFRHPRVWLCEVCEQAPAHVTYKADDATLCVTYDSDIYFTYRYRLTLTADSPSLQTSESSSPAKAPVSSPSTKSPPAAAPTNKLGRTCSDACVEK
nr:uncharacterized protein LOC108172631 [Malus domestica]